MFRILFALMFLVTLVPSSFAAIIVVPDDQPTIAAALAVASGQTKDDIRIKPGTYNESGLLINVNQGGIIIQSSTGNPADVIVDAQGANVVFIVDAPLEFKGITVRGAAGPGIRQNLAGFTVSVTDCVIRNNGLSGLQVDKALVSGTEFRENSGGTAAGVGGGMTVFGSASVSNCRFFDNTAQNGGAINSTGELLVSRTHFEGNSATDGGAVYIEDAQFNFATTTFVDNTAVQAGGACFVRGGASGSVSLEFSDCTFQGNSSTVGGGAVRLIDTDNSGRLMNFTRTVFSLNTSGSGGAIYADRSTLTLGTCTFTSNEAGAGSAVILGTSPATISRSIFAFGTGAGSAVSCMSGATATVTCSNVYDNQGGDWTDCIDGQNGSEGNLSVDPQFCASDPDANSFWFLQTDSPCAITNSPCGGMGAFDTASGCDDTPTEPVTWGSLKRQFGN